MYVLCERLIWCIPILENSRYENENKSRLVCFFFFIVTLGFVIHTVVERINVCVCTLTDGKEGVYNERTNLIHTWCVNGVNRILPIS